MWQTFKEPEDGWTASEKEFMRDVVIAAYKILGDTTNRFIIAMIYECGYTQVEVAQILNISQVAVSKRLTHALGKLRRKRKEGRL